jgi:hypothetical protein
MSEYQAANQEENLRNPKNRFMGLFCHASDVDSSWGNNWPFSCGVILFSIVAGFMTIFDISVIFKKYFQIIEGWFLFWFIIRLLSNLITLIGIIFAILSIIQTNFTRATIAYYSILLSFVLNATFCGYCVFRIFESYFWRKTTYRFFVWILNEFVLFWFSWILFCNMVDIGRKNRQNAGATNF